MPRIRILEGADGWYYEVTLHTKSQEIRVRNRRGIPKEVAEDSAQDVVRLMEHSYIILKELEDTHISEYE